MDRLVHPAPHLRAHVDGYWTFAPRPAWSAPVRVLPDGCMDLVVDLDAGSASIVGTMTRPLLASPRARLLGVRFHPGRLRELVDVSAADATDARLRALGPFARELGERVAAERTTAGQVRALERVLTARLEQARAAHAGARRAIELLTASPGLRVDLVAERAGVGPRQLERLFQELVGVGPKAFARILRFRRAVERLGAVPLAALSVDCGYYDQAHLVREFKAFAGVTPGAYLRAMSDPSKTPAGGRPTLAGGGAT